MSIERLDRQGGTVWRVRWRQGGQNRARVLGRKRDAEAFDAEIRRRKRAGELLESAGARMTLAEFAREWWRLYGEPNLARSTLEGYAILWDRHVLPRIGGVRLRDLTPQVLERFRGELSAAGVGPAAQRKTLVILQGILQRAAEWGYIAGNPAKVVRKPAQRRARRPTAGTVRRRAAPRPPSRRPRPAGRHTRLRPRVRGPPPRRGARAHLGPCPRPHDPRRAIRLARGGEGDQDRPASIGSAPRSACRRPHRVASRLRAADG